MCGIVTEETETVKKTCGKKVKTESEGADWHGSRMRGRGSRGGREKKKTLIVNRVSNKSF